MGDGMAMEESFRGEAVDARRKRRRSGRFLNMGDLPGLGEGGPSIPLLRR
jgi:hypothetical protein